MTSRSEAAAVAGLFAYLSACRELAALCSQNGWIDNDTLHVDLLQRDEDSLLAAVTFDEVIMEGAGCVAGRIPCYGRLRARLGPRGEVEGVELL